MLATGYGDCKDKATLFVAVVKALGFQAYPALLNSGGRVDPALPSIAQFDHAIAAVERPAGRVYVDLPPTWSPTASCRHPIRASSPWWCIPTAGPNRSCFPRPVPAPT